MTNVKTLYFDESGYTGYDLLNPEQPVFSVASIDLSDSEAETILLSSFPGYQGTEFKFTRLWASRRHRRGFQSFSKMVGANQARMFVYACDKKFTLLTKAVDILVEPVVHGAGFDFYKSGFNRGFVNMFHFALINFADAALYDAIVTAYADFSRNPTLDTLAALQWKYGMMAKSCPERLEPLMGLLSLGADHYDLENMGRQRKSNDIQFTTMLASIHYWRSKTKADLEVVYDATANFFRQRSWWEQITSPELAAAVVGTANEDMVFPLRVVNTRPEDSVNSRSLQLSDVLAGLLARLLAPEHLTLDESFRFELLEAGLAELTVDGIRPDTKFVEGQYSPKQAQTWSINFLRQFPENDTGNRGVAEFKPSFACTAIYSIDFESHPQYMVNRA